MGRSVGRRVAAAAIALATAATVAACGIGPSGRAAPTRLQSSAAPARTGTPQLRVDVIARGLTNISDVGFLPDGKVLVSQLDGRFSLLSSSEPGAAITPVVADVGDVYVRGGAGLMGFAVHPDFAQSHRFTTCQSHADRGTPTDIRLVTWELSTDERSARRVVDPLVGGLPITATGRNSGCRPTIAGDGALLVGTGDSARGTVPQDLASLGGKVLRIDLGNGGPPLGNPYAGEDNPATRLIFNVGHSNVTGIAVDPTTGNAYSTETGATTDDEVNTILPKANYGWDPGRKGVAYDTTGAMTDLVHHPDALAAAWSSGKPVVGVSGAAFIDGPQWGDLDGDLAVTASTGKALLLMTVGPDGKITDTSKPAPLTTAFGALSGVRLSPDDNLVVTTANGTDDKVLRVVPT